jgi:3-methyladenine DNA glycosylase AlkD
MCLKKLKSEILSRRNKEKAKILQKFFKTGKGQYGYGDIFLGITVPEQRKIVKRYKDSISLKDIEKLLESKFHEERLIALLLLVAKYDSSYKKSQHNQALKEFFKLYIKNLERVNNWDLVDLSAPNIVGRFLFHNPSNTLLEYLAHSENLWKRRVSIISTFYFIRKNQFEDCLKIAKILLKDEEDLIQKAVGWMLREVGKRDLETEEEFLKKHYKNMPRTMLRYAIERFEESKRKKYLLGEI